VKTFSHLWQYLAKFSLEWEMLRQKLSISSFFRISCPLWDNVEKCGGTWGATNDVTIWRIRITFWMRKATRAHTHTHTHLYIILTAFPRQQWFANPPRPYVTCKLTVLFIVAAGERQTLPSKRSRPQHPGPHLRTIQELLAACLICVAEISLLVRVVVIIITVIIIMWVITCSPSLIPTSFGLRQNPINERQNTVLQTYHHAI
jgi:hypothetical protein